MVLTGGRTGRRHGDGWRIMSKFVSLSHTLRRWGTCTKRRGARTTHVLLSLSQPHPCGYTVELIFVRKGSPRGNLTRVLVVHLVDGGSLYTGVVLMCLVNSQNEEKLS